jgi:sigma-54 dependent transcriptional regulator, acetoin dehydrogenase operon transcriptional activator AcoR
VQHFLDLTVNACRQSIGTEFNRLDLLMVAERSGIRSIATLPLEVKAGDLLAARATGLTPSRQRCVERFNLDMGMKPRIGCLTTREVREHQEPFEDLLSTIEEELDFIWLPLSSVNFSASFSNMAGTIVYYRSDHQSGNYVESERAGTLWAEGIAGTNGVGTCVIERRPTEVFQAEHFFRDFATMSCAAAPVLSADAEMTGVLNFCTADPKLREDLFLIVAGLVRKTADRLNNHLFRRRYIGNTLLKARSEAGPILLALNDNAEVTGANQLARRWLNLAEGPLKPESLGSLLDVDQPSQAEMHKSGMLVMRHRNGEIVFKITRDGRSLSSASVDRAVRMRENSVPNPRRKVVEPPTVDECLGSDPRVARQRQLLRRVSGSRLPLLVLGETGCGKDALARAFHLEGMRRDRPFVAFNCAAIPETLIDSELFGYTAGAFTGARREGNVGRLIEADGGTLFLDEIGDMPLALQTRLLRVLESGEVNPLGSSKTRIIDVQVIAATNHDLKARVAGGRFRADLYHRLAGVVINLLPLRDRQDAVSLFEKMLKRLSDGRPVTLSAAAVEAMRRHRWPGNVREMKFTLQRALQICAGDIILPDDLMIEDVAADERVSATTKESSRQQPTAQAARAESERAAIVEALLKSDGDVSRTAAMLDVSRATLYRKLKQHDLHR